MLGERFDVVKYLVKNIYNITYCQSLPDKLWDVTRDSLIYENFNYHPRTYHLDKFTILSE